MTSVLTRVIGDDPVIAAEHARQAGQIELIASENLVSPAVMAAQGSVFTNKYAEGYPGRRYYGGCEHSDTVEAVAIARAAEAVAAEVQALCRRFPLYEK